MLDLREAHFVNGQDGVAEASSKGSEVSRERAVPRFLKDWLGGRDSNPDTVVQSHVSYRWTTSQYQPRCADRQELSIIANPSQAVQKRIHPAPRLILGSRGTIASHRLAVHHLIVG